MADHPDYYSQDGDNDQFEAGAQPIQGRENSPLRRTDALARGNSRPGRSARTPAHAGPRRRSYATDPIPRPPYRDQGEPGPFAVARNPMTHDKHFEYVQDHEGNVYRPGRLQQPLCNFCGHRSHPRSVCGHRNRMRDQGNLAEFHPQFRDNVAAATATEGPTANFQSQHGHRGGRGRRGRGGGHRSDGSGQGAAATAGEGVGRNPYAQGQRVQVPEPQPFDPRGSWVARPRAEQDRRNRLPSLQHIIANSQRQLTQSTHDMCLDLAHAQQQAACAAPTLQRVALDLALTQEEANGGQAADAHPAYTLPQLRTSANKVYTCAICRSTFANATAYAVHMHADHNGVWM